MLKFATWNLRDYGRYHSRGDRIRYSAIPNVLAGLADVIAVQEVCGLEQLRRLAKAADLCCEAPAATGVDGVRAAFDPGHRGLGVALLWRPEVTAVAESLRTYEKARLYHGMVLADFEVDGAEITAVSTHFTPWGLNLRYDEATMVARMLGNYSDKVIVGLDGNCVSATRTADGEFYDEDPFAGRPWQARFLDKCRFDMDGGHAADRMPMAAMDRGGFFDVTAELNVPWQATVGHWAESDDVPKRIDGARATRAVVDAVTSSRVVDTELTRGLSDHLPVVYEIDTTRLGA